MGSRIPARPGSSTPSPLPIHFNDDKVALDARATGSGSLPMRGFNSSGPTPPRARTEGGAAEVEKVRVYARIRPALRDDETPGALAWDEARGQVTIFRPDAPVAQSDFVFTKVLSPTRNQADVYTAAVAPVVEDVLRGYNGTVLAYGQTGAGKTYTLGNTSPDAIGMIPRAAAEIFAAAAQDPLHTYRVTLSYVQIYMEMIQDLLNPTADNLAIREDGGSGGGVYVCGAAEVPVTRLEECLHYLELGEQNRVFAFTHLNAHSSRSHAVVMLTVVKARKQLSPEERAAAEEPDTRGVVAQKVTVGRLHLVDLAGSERLKKSRSTGLRAAEARAINLSLTSLGMCISARAQDLAHVPFRDSKLTRLLQESLGGNAKTSLILCLSDVRQHSDESLQSLQFGARAACVRNRPVVNERLAVRQVTAELLAALEVGAERMGGLEAALNCTTAERDALQAALARERARSAAIVEALHAEAEARHRAATESLAAAHEAALGEVAAREERLEEQVAALQDELARQREAAEAEAEELRSRLAEMEAERQAEAEDGASRQAILEAREAATRTRAAALASRLAAERSANREAAAEVHLALARLAAALGELAAAPPQGQANGAEEQEFGRTQASGSGAQSQCEVAGSSEEPTVTGDVHRIGASAADRSGLTAEAGPQLAAPLGVSSSMPPGPWWAAGLAAVADRRRGASASSALASATASCGPATAPSHGSALSAVAAALGLGLADKKTAASESIPSGLGPHELNGAAPLSHGSPHGRSVPSACSAASAPTYHGTPTSGAPHGVSAISGVASLEPALSTASTPIAPLGGPQRGAALPADYPPTTQSPPPSNKALASSTPASGAGPSHGRASSVFASTGFESSVAAATAHAPPLSLSDSDEGVSADGVPHLSPNPAFDATDSDGPTAVLSMTLAPGGAEADVGEQGPRSDVYAAAPAPSPLHTAGIRLQLAALADAAAAARNIRRQLEERAAVADVQAVELSTLREEQRAVQNSAEAVVAELEVTLQQLGAAEARLEVQQSQLESTARALEEREAELEQRTEELQACAALLDQRTAELEERSAELADCRAALESARLALDISRGEGGDLAARVVAAEAELAAARTAASSSAAAVERSTAAAADALAKRNDLHRRARAASTIAAGWRRWKLAALQRRVEAEQQALAAATSAVQDVEKQAAEQQAAVQASVQAAAGAALVAESVGVMRAAVASVLTTFVGRKAQLEASAQLAERLKALLPPPGQAKGKGPAAPSGTVAAATAAAKWRQRAQPASASALLVAAAAQAKSAGSRLEAPATTAVTPPETAEVAGSPVTRGANGALRAQVPSAEQAGAPAAARQGNGVAASTGSALVPVAEGA